MDLSVLCVPALGAPVAERWREAQARHTPTGKFVVAAPLSRTPVPVYEHIVASADTFSRWDRVRFCLMDELVERRGPAWHYVAPDDPASYQGFARRHLLAPLRERTGVDVPVLKPDLAALGAFTERIDLLILALGVDGNYANVMPRGPGNAGTPVTCGWHLADLSEQFRSAHTAVAGAAYEGARFRERGMSLGPQQVLDAEEVIVAISGATKAPLARRLLSLREFTEDFPLSVVWHPQVRERVTVYVTEDVDANSDSLGGAEGI